MKQKKSFSQGKYSDMTLFSLVVKYWIIKYYISMTFIIGTFQSHWKSEHNQVKWNKTAWGMCKSDSIFFIYKVVQCLNENS